MTTVKKFSIFAQFFLLCCTSKNPFLKTFCPWLKQTTFEHKHSLIKNNVFPNIFRVYQFFLFSEKFTRVPRDQFNSFRFYLKHGKNILSKHLRSFHNARCSTTDRTCFEREFFSPSCSELAVECGWSSRISQKVWKFGLSWKKNFFLRKNLKLFQKNRWSGNLAVKYLSIDCFSWNCLFNFGFMIFLKN